MLKRKILIMGLPGAGKTTLARTLVPLLSAVWFNADDIRTNINRDLGFTEEDRLEQARRMGWLCNRVTDTGNFAVADFICPTKATREIFGADYTIWVDRIKAGRFEDTNKAFEPPNPHVPDGYDLRVFGDFPPRYWAQKAVDDLVPTFKWKEPTALFLGRYQPFHDGHLKLIEEGLQRVGQVIIAVRNTTGTEGNPFDYERIKYDIEAKMRPYIGRYVIMQVPNITNIFYGRDVGYNIEMIDLDAATKSISATKIRKEIGDGTHNISVSS